MSGSQPGDEQNGSFGAVTRSSQNVKSGIVSGAPLADADEAKKHRRRPSKETDARGPLAKRIRERERK
jgi:hypothetical protein